MADKETNVQKDVQGGVNTVVQVATANYAATGAVIGGIVGLPAGPIGVMVCAGLGSWIGHLVNQNKPGK